MKRLIKLLALVAITTPTSLSIVACGQGKTAPEDTTNKNDIGNLLKLVKEKVENELGVLSSKGNNNIIKDNIFQGGLGKQLADAIEIVGNDAVITNDTVRNEFNKIIVQNISDHINPVLFKDPQFKPLFGNLNEKDILKVNTTKTVWTKNKFNWAYDGSDKFGIAAADYNNYIQGTTFWYKMTTTISYDITYKDNNNKTQTRNNETADYTLYYANKDAKVGSIVEVVIAKFKENIRDYVNEIKLGTERMNFYDDFAPLIGKLKTAAITKLEGTTKITPTINQSLLDDQDEGSLTYDVNTEMGFNNPDRTTKFKSYPLLANKKVDFQQKYESLLTPVATTYTTKLNAQIAKWKTEDLYKNINITDPDKVVFYGSYMLNDWSYQDLTLTPIDIPMIVTIDTTVSEELTNISNSMANLMATDGALINKITTDSAGQTLKLKMNKTDFEIAKTNGSTFRDGFDYISNKIITNNTNWFKTTDKFKFGPIGGDDNALDTELASKLTTDTFQQTFYTGDPLFANININGFNFYLNTSGWNNTSQLNIDNAKNDSTWTK